jgi:hypothetical protein
MFGFDPKSTLMPKPSETSIFTVKMPGMPPCFRRIAKGV